MKSDAWSLPRFTCQSTLTPVCEPLDQPIERLKHKVSVSLFSL
jgi:hypothetical protein